MLKKLIFLLICILCRYGHLIHLIYDWNVIFGHFCFIIVSKMEQLVEILFALLNKDLCTSTVKKNLESLSY